MLLASVAPDEALVRLGVVQPAQLERDEAGLAEVQGLLEPSLGEVPEVQPLPVTAGGDVLDVEARFVGVRLAELRGDQRVLARLVPEVVAQARLGAAVLPASLDLEAPRVEHREAARPCAVRVAEHADHDVVARHAVHRVRARVARLLDELLRLDHLLDPRPPGVVRDVDHMDPRRAKPWHDQMRTIRPVTRRAAAVPAEVMELVADVRHRRLIDDPALFGVDHGEEVGCLDACAPVQASEVEQLLRRCLQRLLRRSVERRGAALLVGLAHREPPSSCRSCSQRSTAPVRVAGQGLWPGRRTARRSGWPMR